jgi:hypothetical protein
LAFQDVSNKIKVPTNFDDYLGKGFSGDVIGKERVKVLISDFNSQTNSSFPGL